MTIVSTRNDKDILVTDHCSQPFPVGQTGLSAPKSEATTTASKLAPKVGQLINRVRGECLDDFACSIDLRSEEM